jgi:hypothetical protein
MLDNVVSLIACVSMNHQNQLEQMTNGAMFATVTPPIARGLPWWGSGDQGRGWLRGAAAQPPPRASPLAAGHDRILVVYLSAMAATQSLVGERQPVRLRPTVMEWQWPRLELLDSFTRHTILALRS